MCNPYEQNTLRTAGWSQFDYHGIIAGSITSMRIRVAYFPIVLANRVFVRV